jgi:uncharacterized protein (DUF362 family)
MTQEQHDKSRRDFMKGMAGLAVSAAFLGSCSEDEDNTGSGPVAPDREDPRTGPANPYTNAQNQPILVSVEGDDFSAMLTAGMAALGGFELLTDGAEHVLVKPNCNYAEDYPGVSDAASVADIVSALGQAGVNSVRVGDQSYGVTSEVFEHMGLAAAVTGAGGSLVTLDDNSVIRVRHSDWAGTVPDYLVYSEVYNAPVIINTCNIKRHFLGKMTCALKNNVGTISGSGGTVSRDNLHSLEGNNFLRRVADIAGLVSPDLNIVDARKALTVNGPFVRNGVVVDANRLVLCGDMVATDAYCAQFLASIDATFDPATVNPTLDRAVELGLGTRDLAQVEVIELSVSG